MKTTRAMIRRWVSEWPPSPNHYPHHQTPDATMSTTISSLLNSLHTHLQAQTQLLPALHTQLGLQPTALADDLATLQQELTQCVEAQIDARMKQVDEWMKKSEDVEKECIRYGKALGTHVRTEVGSSVGEIRKEQVLPRRFEMISEYLGKLRQVHFTLRADKLILLKQSLALSYKTGPIIRRHQTTHYSLSDVGVRFLLVRLN